MGKNMQPLVVVPTYNEIANIEPLLTAILAIAPTIHVLVVDDGSPDGTGDCAEQIAARTHRVRVMHRSGKLGLATAYIAGFRYALAQGYDRIVQMDADFSHRPEDLPRLLALSTRADVVIGSRNIPGGRAENWSPLRHVISKGGSLYARMLLGLPIKDCTSGFKCFRREALATIDLERVASNGYGFQVEMNYLCYRAGLRFAEAPIVFPDRTAGRSKMSGSIVSEAATVVWRLRREAPHAVPGRARSLAPLPVARAATASVDTLPSPVIEVARR